MAKTSMQDIADALHISKNAVSLAINGKPGISDSLREKIIEKAEELNYIGLRKVKLKKKNLLLIVHDKFERDNEFFLPLISSILRNSAEMGYTMVMVSVNDEMQEKCIIPSAFYETDASGVIFLGLIRRNYLEFYVKEKIPCVMMLLHHYGVPVDYILSANVDGAYAVTKYMISCGHKKIGYMADVGTYSSFRERLQGYRCALSESGLDREEQYEFLTYSESGFAENKDVEVLADRIVCMENPPTAWVCGNDEMAMRLMNALNERGLRVPDDVSIAGFDGLRMVYLAHPKLCTYQVSRDILGKKAVELLIRRIESVAVPVPVVKSIMGDLIEGESVKIIR